MSGGIGLYFLNLIIASALGFSMDVYPVRPDPSRTNGDLCSRGDVDFIGYRYSEHIAYCARAVNEKTKEEIYDEYGVPRSKRRSYTIDHFIPLALGGNNARNNLWPEPKAIKKLRLNLETEMFEALRDGTMTQKEAIRKVVEAKMNPPLPGNN